MKKIFLATAILLSLSTAAFCAESTPATPSQQYINQKACPNVFSFINFDISLMSPRATVTDSPVEIMPPPPPMGPNAVVPIANKAAVKPCCPPEKKEFRPEPPKNKTSLFRLDLLHIFKIQIL